MKKFMNIFAAALVMLAALGCEKSETLPDISSKVITLSAAINNGGTKTSLGTWDSENEEYPVLWSADDAIAVVNNGKLFKFVVNLGAGTTQGTFTCTEGQGFDPTQPIKAYYPYEGVTYENGTISYTIPATQTYQANSFGPGAMPMAGYAANAEGVISFDNLFGVLKLQLTGNGNEKLQSIEILSDKAVSGSAKISFDSKNKPTLTMSSSPNVEQAKVVLKKSSEDIVLSDTPTEVLIAIPAAKHTFSVYIITDQGAYYKKAYNKNEISAGYIQKMPVLNLVEFTHKMAYVENGVYYGDGIALPKSETETIIWAPVNCGYDEKHPYGLLYQWGRKYGQGYGGDGECEPESPIAFCDYQSASAKNGSLLKYREDFYYGYYNWLSEDDYYLWKHSSSTQKTAYDPCPEGWRVPTISDLESLVDGTKEDGSIDGMKGIYFYGSSKTDDKVFFPAAGYRNYKGSVYNGKTETRGRLGRYWSSQATKVFSSGSAGASQEAYSIWFDTSQHPSAAASLREETIHPAYGYSVRCVKE